MYARAAWEFTFRSFVGMLKSHERDVIMRKFNEWGATQEAAEYLMLVHSGGEVVLPMPHLVMYLRNRCR